MRSSHFFKAILLIYLSAFLIGCGDDEDDTSSSITTEETATTTDTAETDNLGETQTTGKITADDFFLLYIPGEPEVFDRDKNYTEKEVVISIQADDVNDMSNLSGHTVNFKVEWGRWKEGDSCTLENGECSVVWISGDPATAPADCRVAVSAWAEGEESFVDLNDNNVFDTSESFTDLSEPFLDINSNGIYDPQVFAGQVGELIDIVNFDGTTPDTSNGLHDNPDGFYTGTLCAAENSSRCSDQASMIIHTRSSLWIQKPFDHDNDFSTPFSRDCEW